jgi:hypothetical protein
VVDGLLLRVFDRVRQTALYGCCDDPVCDLQLMLHQFTLRAVERVRYIAHATQTQCRAHNRGHLVVRGVQL